MRSEKSSSENELYIFLQIDHENVVRYYDHFYGQISGDDYTFLVTEYCEVSIETRVTLKVTYKVSGVK